MHKFIAQWKHAIKQMNLEDRLFAILLVFAMVVSVANVCLNMMIGFNFNANYKWFAFFVSAVWALWYQYQSGKSQLTRNVIFFEIVYCFLPNGWLMTQGNSNSTMAYLFLITVLICLVLENRSRIFFIVSEVLIVTGLLWYEYQSAVSMTTDEQMVFKIDALIQVPLALMAAMFILVLFSNAYRKEGRTLTEYSTLLEERNRALTDITVTDELTGVYNRRFVFQKLEEIKQFLDLMTYQVYVAIIDIDNFKTINDAFGHITGDQVLKNVSHLMKEIVADKGYVGRYGGDEFVIVFTGVSRQEAKLIIECVRQDVQSLSMFDGFSVTVSGGMSRFYDADEIDVALNRADAMLYKAKNESKNRIMLEG